MNGQLVTLTPAEVEAATEQGMAKHKNARALGLDNRHGFTPDNGREDIEGRAAELAVCKLFGIFPGAFDVTESLIHRHEGDVDGCYEVRHSRLDSACLIIRPGDCDKRPYILVVGGIPNLYVVGWLYGAEGKDERWLRNPGGRPPAYFVPQAALREIDQLIKLHLQRRFGGGQ
ncbi:MAG TPA: hypothetical protein VL155_15450 [Terriglobales bacterium]|jgi:hypothetical protein|nr:hypothetical protein [Terriglobales bacterium]